MKKIKAIRGAVCSENTKEAIIENVCQMCNKIFSKNNLASEDLISIQFSITEEITKLNPASALRLGKTSIDVTQCALFCCQEAKIENGMKNVIRVMITTYMDDIEKTNIYLNGAEKLRPDYSK
ncbi:MAG: chorismate mutase [Treponema sp.]|nr:chorismate mutase [Treponema sp.]